MHDKYKVQNIALKFAHDCDKQSRFSCHSKSMIVCLPEISSILNDKSISTVMFNIKLVSNDCNCEWYKNNGYDLNFGVFSVPRIPNNQILIGNVENSRTYENVVADITNVITNNNVCDPLNMVARIYSRGITKHEFYCFQSFYNDSWTKCYHTFAKITYSYGTYST